jgi:hypothetical protein
MTDSTNYPYAGGDVGGSTAVGGSTGGTGYDSGTYDAGSTAAGSRAASYDPTDASLGELLGNVTNDLSTLMRQEVALAKAEVTIEAKKAGGAAGMLAGAGFAGYMTILFLSVALMYLLSQIMDNGWAALIVAVLWGIVAAVLASMGRKKLKEINPPQQTVETLQQAPEALRPNPARVQEETR